LSTTTTTYPTNIDFFVTCTGGVPSVLLGGEEEESGQDEYATGGEWTAFSWTGNQLTNYHPVTKASIIIAMLSFLSSHQHEIGGEYDQDPPLGPDGGMDAQVWTHLPLHFIW